MQHQQMDFVAHKSSQSRPQPSAEPPVPVTSAKAAINALYAERARKTKPILVPSAREAVNAAAGQGAGRNAKSASNLHHGSIQKNIEKNIDTSRTSAAALLTRAKSPKPSAKETNAENSYDPLASRLPSVKSAPKDADEQEIPVIRTSLKLGSSAKPKQGPVILPPNARMAKSARPVGGLRPKTGIISRRPGDVQIIQPNSINPSSAKRISSGAKQLASGSSNTLEVQILPSTKSLPAKAPAQLVKSAPAVPKPARVPRPAGPSRDPQMLGGAPRRGAKPGATPLWPAAAASALSPKPKFRPAPKGYASATPTGVPADSSYVMATPPKINLSRHHAPEAEFGVVEDYHPSSVPEPLPAKAPTGQPPASPAKSIQADNTANYSFLKKKPADNNRYALGGQSPFLKSVSVEKRPLSDNSAPGRTKIARPVIEDKPTKASRKNVYAKKKSKNEVRQELPQRPTVIVPASRRSKVPLFFLILFTIILGAVVGAATYLCFFQ